MLFWPLCRLPLTFYENLYSLSLSLSQNLSLKNGHDDETAKRASFLYECVYFSYVQQARWCLVVYFFHSFIIVVRAIYTDNDNKLSLSLSLPVQMRRHTQKFLNTKNMRNVSTENAVNVSLDHHDLLINRSFLDTTDVHER